MLGDDEDQLHVHGGAWKSPFPIHSANASRYKAEKELVALEDHVKVDPCPRCMNKHLTAAIVFLEEAGGLDGGTEEDVRKADRLEAVRGALRGDRWSALPELRALRAALAVEIGHV